MLLTACSHQINPVKGVMTVINRTEAEVILTSEGHELRVPACSEASMPDMRLNSWQLTSPGRDTFGSGNSLAGPQSYMVVTRSVTVSDDRPTSVPKCEGLLQPGAAGG